MLYIWMYYGNRQKDFYLPEKTMWKCEFALYHQETGFLTDIVFDVRALEGEWFIACREGMRWRDQPSEITERILSDGLRTVADHVSGASVGIIVSSYRERNTLFTKYNIARVPNITIGRDEHNMVCFGPLASGRHAELQMKNGTCILRDHSSNGSYINGRCIKGETASVAFGDQIAILTGLKIIYLGDTLAINNPDQLVHVKLPKYESTQQKGLVIDEDGSPTSVLFHRAPRLLTSVQSELVEIEPPIAKAQQARIPLLMSIGPSITMSIPMLMGSVIASLAGNSRGFMASGLTMVGTSSVLAIMWALINIRFSKKQSGLSEQARIQLYERYIEECEARLAQLSESELKRLNNTHLDARQCAQLSTDSGRLFERMPTHTDFLEIRVGNGRVPLPNPIQITKNKLSLVDDQLRNEASRLYNKYSFIQDAPVTIHLGKDNIIGVLGNARVRTAQSMLIELCALHSYHDVRIAVITGESDYGDWAWTRWLPHVFADSDRKLRMVAGRPSSVHEVLIHIDEVLSMRAENRNARNATQGEQEDSAQPLPHYVVFVTDVSLLKGQLMLRYLTAEVYGISLVVLGESLGRLPKETRVVLMTDDEAGGLYTSVGSTQALRFEHFDESARYAFAKRLAPVRVAESAQLRAIPQLVTFFDIYGIRSKEELDVWRFWNENKAYEGLGSKIGLKEGAQAFTLDISELYHGPHGLIAGTTGAGKSVMLETFILSLALNYPPKQLNFILIDYKGGGMAQAFQMLPHVAGTIDNLQSELIIGRALISIRGEIHRREEIFKHVGVNNIDDYIRYYNDDPTEASLAHLVIVVDEFAELRKEKPDFMYELVSASRVGRSLGVHLILATQKPGSSVDPEIVSNTRFRVCLRVQDRADSMEMLHRPDAAYLKGMGRCYVQVGSDEVFEQVQTGWSGAEYDPEAMRPDELPGILDEIGRATFMRHRQAKTNDARKKTQKDEVMELIQDAVKMHHVKCAQKLWLKPLETRMRLMSIADSTEMFDGDHWPAAKADGLAAIFAMADDVVHQAYIPVALNLEKNRNHAIIGISGSGKTTALQTLALSLAMRYSPAQVHLYAFSLSGRILSGIAALPHTGDIVYEAEGQLIKRLLNMLIVENERRKNIFAEAYTDSFFEYNQYAKHNGRTEIPATVVMVDRFAQLKEALGEDEWALFMRLGHEGSGRGIYFVVTAYTPGELGRMSDVFRGVALQLNERSDYNEALGIRVPPEMLSIMNTPGRGIVVVEEQPYEIQTAVYGDEPSDMARTKAIEQLGVAMHAAYHGDLPNPVPRIPENPTWTMLCQNQLCVAARHDMAALPVGYRVMEGTPLIIDLGAQHAQLVIGERASGKSAFMRHAARTLAAKGVKVHMVGASFTGVAQEVGAALHSPETEEWISFITGLRDEIKLRHALLQEGQPASHPGLNPIALLIDDLDQIVAQKRNEINEFLGLCCVKAAGFGLFIVASINNRNYIRVAQSEPVVSLVSRGAGVVLGGRISEINPWGMNVPYELRNQQIQENEGYLVQRSEIVRIVLPSEK